jgi:2-dehydropantoate 2-reductase
VKVRIGIIGIGAVGGYFGGMLAKHYFDSAEVEIVFIARPKTVEVIRKNGLKLITPSFETIIHPALVSNDPSEVGQLDMLICCTKSYDLASSIEQYKSCITDKTILLPLLNGVDGKEIIQDVIPGKEVWDGCVYIVSRLLEPGVVKDSGNIHSLYFGSVNGDKNKLKLYEKIFKDAGIDTHLSENIERTIWEKFLFISCAASLTTYYDRPIGEILKDPLQRKVLVAMLGELYVLGQTIGIEFSDDILERTMKLMDNFPPGTTSSMHSDFKKGGRTEYRSLTEYVLKLATKNNVQVMNYKNVLEGLKMKVHE